MSEDAAVQIPSTALLASGKQALDLDILSSIEVTDAITPDEGVEEERRVEEGKGDEGEDFPNRRRLGSPEVVSRYCSYTNNGCSSICLRDRLI